MIFTALRTNDGIGDAVVSGVTLRVRFPTPKAGWIVGSPPKASRPIVASRGTDSETVSDCIDCSKKRVTLAAKKAPAVGLALH